jgi:hypothetical protein
MIDKAVSAFLLEVVATHGDPADIICSKVGNSKFIIFSVATHGD